MRGNTFRFELFRFVYMLVDVEQDIPPCLWLTFCLLLVVHGHITRHYCYERVDQLLYQLLLQHLLRSHPLQDGLAYRPHQRLIAGVKKNLATQMMAILKNILQLYYPITQVAVLLARCQLRLQLYIIKPNEQEA